MNLFKLIIALLLALSFGWTGAGSGMERISIAEYYSRAKPADDIMPGLRVQDFGYASAITDGFSIKGEEWNHIFFYNKNHRKGIRKIFKDIEGKIIDVGDDSYTFIFSRFYNLMTIKRKEVIFVNFQGPYLHLPVPEEKRVYVLPLTDKLISELRAKYCVSNVLNCK